MMAGHDYKAAEATAETLLESWLSLEQFVQYRREGCFYVTGSHTGRRYRVGFLPHAYLVCAEGLGYGFFPGIVPYRADIMLAQKIVLENDENAALRIACQCKNQR